MWQTWVLIFILFLAFLFGMAWFIGTRQAKLDYKKEYEQLEMYVHRSLIKRSYFDFIKQKFEGIQKYRCKDKEKLSVLEAEFYRHFEKLEAGLDEFDPENVI